MRAERGGARIARPAACWECRGGGMVPAVGCVACLFLARVGGPAAALFPPGVTTLPCGHRGGTVLLDALCPACGGTGAGTAWKTAGQWARLDAREAAGAKRARSLAAQVLHEAGPLWGQTRREWRGMVALLTPPCGRRSRHTGQPCRLPCVRGRARCRLHGGLSTGPRTETGREAIRASNRRRAATPVPPAPVLPAAVATEPPRAAACTAGA